MNLAQFLRAYSVEQFSRWGVPFNSKEEALAAVECFPLETKPEQFGSVTQKIGINQTFLFMTPLCERESQQYES